MTLGHANITGDMPATSAVDVPTTAAGADDALQHYWALPMAQLLDALRVARTGLSQADAARRLATNGPVPARHDRSRLPHLVAAQLANPIAVLLLVAAAISFGVGERVDGAIVVGILVLGGLLGLRQEYRAADAVARLLAMVHTTAAVLRDGQLTDVPAEQVVVGDVIRLAAGAIVPGDARVLEASDLFVDQAVLTGESAPAEKTAGVCDVRTPLAARTNVVYQGTHVSSGMALAVIVRTGARTEFGAIAGRLVLRPAETAFERGIHRFGYLLLQVVTVLLILILAVNLWLGRPLLDVLLFTLALAVGLTPQLLPAIVGVTLAQGARHMARERVIVRRLASIEDLGARDVLCTDKTGTITEGIVAIHAAEDWRGAPSEHVRLLAYLNAAHETGFANPIDAALRAAAPPDAARWRKVDEIPWDFVRRRLSVVVGDGDRCMLVTKGALAAVLDACDRVEEDAGATRPLGDVRDAIETRLETLSRQGYRCLGVAWRDVPTPGLVQRADERGLVFAGIVTLADPLKRDVRASLAELARLGVRVQLVTGDNRHVAARVAADAGIDATLVRTGAELERLGESALVSAAPRVGVFAEVTPAQKERVIRALRKAGHTVGYLGDGINDAAALHAADVGVSVDSATDVTRRAADIVLLEKDLRVLARGVREGRRAFANTLKYVFITASANFGNMVSMAVASLFTTFLPMLPKQILLVNLLSDLPAMAIATDRLDPELVARPRRWDDRAVRRFMVGFGLVSSAFDMLTFGVLLLLAVPPAVFRTAWFIESLLSELLVLLVIRTRRPLFRSRPGTALLWLSVGVASVALALPWTPFAAMLGLAPLNGPLMATLATVLTLYVIASQASKRWLTNRTLF